MPAHRAGRLPGCSKGVKAEVSTSKEGLLREYDALEDAIENAATAGYWNLADWLVANVPGAGHGGDRHSSAFKGTQVPLKMEELAERRDRSVRWLRIMLDYRRLLAS